MPALTRILVATDFGGPAQHAVAEAFALARRVEAEVVLLHAIQPPTIPEFGGDEELARAVDEAREVCERIKEASDEGVVFAGEPVVEVGDAAAAILKAADDFDVDLIMLGAEPRAALSVLLFDPTLEKVMRASKRPVWLVRPEGDPARLERLLCAVDPSRPTGKALDVSLFLAHTLNAALDLAVVVPPSRTRAGDPEEQVAWLERYVRDFGDEELRQAVSIEYVAHDGSAPGARLLELAAQRGSDLLVVGSGGRSSLLRWLRGQTAGQLARRAPCSLLTVRTVEPAESGRLVRVDEPG